MLSGKSQQLFFIGDLMLFRLPSKRLMEKNLWDCLFLCLACLDSFCFIDSHWNASIAGVLHLIFRFSEDLVVGHKTSLSFEFCGGFSVSYVIIYVPPLVIFSLSF